MEVLSISLASFAGVKPRPDPRLLGNENAQIAKNCHFNNGNLSPLREPLLTGDTFSASTKTIFKYLYLHWFTWIVEVDAVKSPVANDPWERVYFTGDGWPKVTNNTIFSGGTMPAVSFRLGIQAPESVITGVITEAPVVEGEEAILADPNDDEDRYYTHTFVTEQGEEGPPGEASAKLTLLTPEDLNTFVTLSFSPPNVNNSNITHRRIYRTVTGGGIADYLLVTELPIATTTFIDDLQADEINLPLETYDYVMPPADLQGLVTMANGILSGFFDNTVCFSMAFLPYAWPTDYQMTTQHDVVATVAIGNSLVALTKGYPYIFSGNTPDSMSAVKLGSNQACVSKRSAVVVSGVVMYASPDGLAVITGTSAQVITEKILTREQWLLYEPETIEAYYQEGKYFAIYGANLDKSFIYDPATSDFRHYDIGGECGYNSLVDDALYLCDSGVLSQWEEAQTTLDYLWRSKVFTFSDMNFCCCLVKGKNLDLTGMRIYVDGVEILHIAPTGLSTFAFRLGTERGDEWEFELYGSGTVESLIITTSMREIKRINNNFTSSSTSKLTKLLSNISG